MLKGPGSLFAFLLFLAALGRALAAEGPAQSCVDLLDPLARARVIVSQLGHLPGHTESEPMTVKRVGDDGSTLASLVYVMETPTTMQIARAQVASDLRRQGFNKLLTAQALLANPKTARIEAVLAWSNADVFFDTLSALSFRMKFFQPSKANLIAVASTPFYRICKALGFGKIISVRPRGEVIDLTVERADLLDEATTSE